MKLGRTSRNFSIFDLDVPSYFDHPRSPYLRFADGGGSAGSDGGSGSEGGDQGGAGGDPPAGGQNQNPPADNKQDPPKTFTQEEVTRMMTAEKQQGRAAVLKELGITDPTQAKTLLEMAGKMADATKPADQKLDEKDQATLAEKQRADVAEQNLELFKAKAKEDNVNDIRLLVMARVNDKTDFKTALEQVKKAMPQFFEDGDDGQGSNKGTGTPPGNGKGKGDNKANSYGARAAKINKQQRGGKSSFFQHT